MFLLRSGCIIRSVVFNIMWINSTTCSNYSAISSDCRTPYAARPYSTRPTHERFLGAVSWQVTLEWIEFGCVHKLYAEDSDCVYTSRSYVYTCNRNQFDSSPVRSTVTTTAGLLVLFSFYLIFFFATRGRLGYNIKLVQTWTWVGHRWHDSVIVITIFQYKKSYKKALLSQRWPRDAPYIYL